MASSGGGLAPSFAFPRREIGPEPVRPVESLTGPIASRTFRPCWSTRALTASSARTAMSAQTATSELPARTP